MPNTTGIQDESVVDDTSVEVDHAYCVICFSSHKYYRDASRIDDPIFESLRAVTVHDGFKPISELRPIDRDNQLYYVIGRYNVSSNFNYLCHEHSTLCEYDELGSEEMCGKTITANIPNHSIMFIDNIDNLREVPAFYVTDSRLIGYKIDDIRVCPCCRDNNFWCCEDCDNLFESIEQSSNGVDHGDRLVCDRCYQNYYNCGACGTYRHQDDDDHYHDEEEVENRWIRSYNFKQPLIMHQTDDDLKNAVIVQDNQSNWAQPYAAITHLGLELEIECKNGADLDDGVNILVPSIEDDTLVLKHDGSLNYGFEIVSQPMTLSWAKDFFPWDKLSELARMGFRSWNTDTCGLHVHVARDAFISASHQAKFIHLIMRNGDAWRPIGGRTNTHWAKYDRGELYKLPEKIKGRFGNDRYTAVNMCNRATLEIRIFRGSLKPERVKAALEFADACVEYTRELSINEIVSKKGLNADEFIKWASTQEKYSNLNNYFNPNTTEGE